MEMEKELNINGKIYVLKEEVEKDSNSGHSNSGHCNIGHSNSGDCNSGYRNSGDSNSGDRNSGNWNSGYCNSGDWNSGDSNSGDSNSGDSNSGDWNSGDWNNGYCNSITPEKILVFNKECDRKKWFKTKKPAWMYISLTKWIDENKMTDKEKKEYPSYETTGGYLKCYNSLKEAYRESWKNTTEEDRKLTLNLPNFDDEVFKEVFGFSAIKNLEE